MKSRMNALRRSQLEKKLAPLLAARQAFGPEQPRGGWLKVVREALGLTLTQLGERLGTDAASVIRLEAREADGRIALATLERAAAAMDCDVVYAVVPRGGLTAVRRMRAERMADYLLGRIAFTMSLEAQDVGPDTRNEQREEYIRNLLEGRDRELWSRLPGERPSETSDLARRGEADGADDR